MKSRRNLTLDDSAAIEEALEAVRLVCYRQAARSEQEKRATDDDSMLATLVGAVGDLAGRIARPKGSGSLLTSLTRVAAVAVKWVELEQLVERDELERELRRREESR